MSEVLPIQKASFRGIYENVGGIFTPKPLEWTIFDSEFSSPIDFEFTNKRGLTFVLLKINSFSLWVCQISVPKVITDIPFDLFMQQTNTYIVQNPPILNKGRNIIGPFSGSFDTNELVQGQLSGDFPSPYDTVSIAVVRLP